MSRKKCPRHFFLQKVTVSVTTLNVKNISGRRRKRVRLIELLLELVF